ncbi:hypothetical protein GCM10009825_31830 [Arthrobacter humicola]|uniref:Uncharacterized protein n=1 Tax=Arthrobacter humicola TaxID=409291 RepID=A0ABN2ZHU2_9MICC
MCLAADGCLRLLIQQRHPPAGSIRLRRGHEPGQARADHHDIGLDPAPRHPTAARPDTINAGHGFMLTRPGVLGRRIHGTQHRSCNGRHTGSHNGCP